MKTKTKTKTENVNVLKSFYEKMIKKLSVKKPDFMQFVLSGDASEDPFNFEDCTLLKLYKKTSNLSLDHLKALITCPSWSFHAFCFCTANLGMVHNKKLEQCLTEIGQEILNKHHFTVPDDFSSVMQSLIFLHFFDCTILPFLHNFPGLCSSYIPWPDKEQELAEQLQKTSVVFVTGSAGSGKRQLIIRTLQNYNSGNTRDKYWLDVDNSIPIEKKLSDIEFFTKPESSQMLQLLTKKEATSILVIRKTILTEEDLSYIKENLCQLNLHIIISTYTKVSSDDLVTVNVDDRPMENLYQIFQVYDTTSSFDENEFRMLAKNISNNVYVLALIGKALSKRSTTLKKEQLLNQFESLYYETNLPNIHTSYRSEYEKKTTKKSGQRLFFLVKRILAGYPKELISQELYELSIWAKTPIARSSLQKRWSKELLQSWLHYGFLQAYDEDKLFIPRLLADTIWFFYPKDFMEDTAHASISFSNYKETIFSFFNSVSCGKPFSIPYTDLYEIIFQLMLRFHFQVSITDAKDIKKNRPVFQEWNLFLTSVIEYYMQLGNFKYAKELLPCLYLYRTKRGKIQLNENIETAIRELLTLRAEYMSSSDTVSTLSKLQDTLRKFQNDLKEEPEDEALFLSAFISITLDLCDCTVEIALLYIAAILQVKDYPATAQIYACVNALDVCSNFLRKCQICSASYYLSVKHYLISVVGMTYQCDPSLIHTMDQWRFVAYHLEKLGEELPTEDTDTHFKANCMGLCASLTKIFLQPSCEGNSMEPYSLLVERFLQLYESFQKNIWSYHTSHVFFSCVSFLSALLLRKEIDTDRPVASVLMDCMKRYKNFLTAQVSLPESQQTLFLQNIDNCLAQLQDFYSK